ncbi:MAG: amidohydrolase family protein [Candidatus Dormibacteraceae bacterium]
MVVDIHNHFVPGPFVDHIRRHGGRYATELVTQGGREFFLIEKTARRSLNPRVTDLSVRREQMAADGIDAQILSGFPFMTYYDVPVADGQEVARLLNDGLAEAVSADSAHFAGLATVPLQDVDAAVRELERAVDELGLVGVLVLTRAAGLSVDDRTLRPFWEAAARLRAPVLLHPFEAAPSGDLAKHHLGNLLGNPFNTALSAALLILSGVVEELPDLRIVLAHGGGALPIVIGRLDRGWNGARDGGLGPVGAGLSRPPSAWLDRFGYDSITFSPAALRYLVDLVGADHVMLGTDYPAPMQQASPLSGIEAVGLAPEVIGRVLGENAFRLFGLEAIRSARRV